MKTELFGHGIETTNVYSEFQPISSKVWVFLRHYNGLIKSYKVTRVSQYPDGYILEYKINDGKFKKVKQYCAILKTSKLETIDGKRGYYQVHGSVGHVPLNQVPSDAPGDNYAILLRTHGLSEAYKSIASTLTINWKMLLIIAAIAIVGIALYQGFLAPKKDNSTTPTPTPVTSPVPGGFINPIPIK